MSALAKVFVFIVLVLSIIFFGTSATLFKTRTDWRTAYNRLEDESRKGLDEIKKVNAELHARNDSLDKTRINLEANNGELSKGNKQLNEDLKEERTKASLHQSNAAKSADTAAQIAKSLEAKETSFSELQKSLDKVKTDLDGALVQKSDADKSRDSMRLDLEKAQQELHALRMEHHNLVEEHDTLALKSRRYEEILGPDAVAAAVSPVPIDAVISAVESKEKLVVLSAGKDQKVQLGYEFTVYRGGEFVGKVKVIKVFPDVCGAEILFTKDGEDIQRGDKATTQLFNS